MTTRKNFDVDAFIREAQSGTSPARLAVRFGIAMSSVRKIAKAHCVALPTIKDLRRRNGLTVSAKSEPSPR